MERKRLAKKSFLFLIILIILAGVFLMKELGYGYWDGGSSPDVYWEENEKGEKGWPCLILALNKGEYELELSYSAGQEGIWKIEDRNQNDGNNYRGKVLQEGSYPAGEGEKIQIDFSIEKNTDSLYFTFYSDSEDVSVQNWNISLIKDEYTDSLFLFLAAAGVIFALFMVWDWEKQRNYVIMSATGIFLTMPFFGDYLQSGHDLLFHLARIEGIAEGLSQGQFPVRMDTVMNQGLGFLDPIYYPNLFLYPAAILCLLGCSLLNAYKILIFFINIFSAILAYLGFRGLLKSERLGLYCALLYVLNPYHLTNLYLRAALGELLASMFLPLLLYGIYELFCGDYKKWWITAIAATGIVQSHILTVELSVLFVTAFAIPVIIWQIRKKKVCIYRIIALGKTAGACILANAWFLFPLFMQMGRKTAIAGADDVLSRSTVYWQQMFQTSFKMQGGNVFYGAEGEMPETIGLVLLIGLIIYLGYRFFTDKLGKHVYRIADVCALLGILSCYAASTWFPWDWIQSFSVADSLLCVIQYPWRMLGFASLFLSVVSGIAIQELLKDKKVLIAGAMTGLSLWMAVMSMDSYQTDGTTFLKSRTQAYTSAYYADYYDTGIGYDWMWQERNKIDTKADVKISSFRRKGTDLSFSFEFENPEDKDKDMHLPLYDYNEYEIFINGEKISYGQDDKNRILICIPEEMTEGVVQVIYKENKLYRIGDILTGGFIVYLAVYSIKRINRKKCLAGRM